jgi:hypothetical protein
LGFQLYNVPHLDDFKLKSSGFQSNTALDAELDQCFYRILTAIPLPLTLPSSAEIMKILLQQKPKIISKYISLMTTVWSELTREDLIPNLNDIFEFTLLGLDYRRVYGYPYANANLQIIIPSVSDHSEDHHGIIDTDTIKLILTIGLKLTESELKVFLVHLSDWKDVELPSEPNPNLHLFHMTTDTKNRNKRLLSDETLLLYQKYSRGVNFYHLMSEFVSTFKSIFVPLLAPFWNQMNEPLVELKIAVDEINSTKLTQKKGNLTHPSYSFKFPTSNTDEDETRAAELLAVQLNMLLLNSFLLSQHLARGTSPCPMMI